MLNKKIFIYQKIFFIKKNEIKKSITIITKNIRTIQNISSKKIKKKEEKIPQEEEHEEFLSFLQVNEDV